MHSNEAAFEALNAAANRAALYLAGTRETVVPPSLSDSRAAELAAKVGCTVEQVREVHAFAANDTHPSLEQQLAGSVALLAAAAERIEVIETCYAYGKCACDAPLIAREVECAEVYRVTTAIPLRAQTLCSLECVAYALLWDLHPTQDQSDETRDRTIALIASSFERAAMRAKAVR